MAIAFTILSVILSVFAGACKAVCDLSEEGKIKGNQYYWHKNVSWQNKWKYGQRELGEYFWGSSRWFVMFTDAWHLFGFLERISLCASFALTGYLISVNLWYLFLLCNYPVMAAAFHLFYNSKKIRK